MVANPQHLSPAGKVKVLSVYAGYQYLKKFHYKNLLMSGIATTALQFRIEIASNRLQPNIYKN